MIKILIVEDEEPISNLIRMNLTKAGYQCRCAFDGQEAADMMAVGSYDLILLDIMLPKINGYELLEYAQSLNIPVIFITAMGTVENKVKGLKKGADDYISKPFEIVELRPTDAEGGAACAGRTISEESELSEASRWPRPIEEEGGAEAPRNGRKD